MSVSAGCKKDKGWRQKKRRQENCIFMGRPPSQGGRARQTGYITWKIVAKTCTFRNMQIVERYWVFLDARSIFHRQERFMGKGEESISVGASYCVGPFLISVRDSGGSYIMSTAWLIWAWVPLSENLWQAEHGIGTSLDRDSDRVGRIHLLIAH